MTQCNSGELIPIVDGQKTLYQVGEWYHVPAQATHVARYDKTTFQIEFWFYLK
ncbi:Cupin domain-containing protein (fragment) [Hyella patelloides LEGE 07179]|uniref:Cupin domain-containing protein n=1 Tax=Hyella patelloides LEGE 07179 TaxID=945734 RepID=A0A563VSS8_9CYAN